MLRSLLSRFTFRNGTNDEDGDAADGEFRPSQLDPSVLYAHGMDIERFDAEIADVEERAREIENARRNE